MLLFLFFALSKSNTMQKKLVQAICNYNGLLQKKRTKRKICISIADRMLCVLKNLSKNVLKSYETQARAPALVDFQMRTNSRNSFWWKFCVERNTVVLSACHVLVCAVCMVFARSTLWKRWATEAKESGMSGNRRIFWVRNIGTCVWRGGERWMREREPWRGNRTAQQTAKEKVNWREEKNWNWHAGVFKHAFPSQFQMVFMHSS